MEIYFIRIKSSTNPRVWPPGKFLKYYENAYGGRMLTQANSLADADVYVHRGVVEGIVQRFNKEYRNEVQVVVLEVVTFKES